MPTRAIILSKQIQLDLYKMDEFLRFLKGFAARIGRLNIE